MIILSMMNSSEAAQSTDVVIRYVSRKLVLETFKAQEGAWGRLALQSLGDGTSWAYAV